MRIGLAGGLILILVIIIISTPSAFAIGDDRNNGIIIPSSVVFSEEEYTATVCFEGEFKPEDMIIVEQYDKDEHAIWSREYEFTSCLELHFDNITPSDYIRVSLKDVNGIQKAGPSLILFNVIYTKDWLDLANAISYMNSEYLDLVEHVSGDVNYSCGRIIAKVVDNLPDISSFHPVFTVIDEENHYFIQFLRDIDAKECEQYLKTNENVIYVEPDNVMYSTED